MGSREDPQMGIEACQALHIPATPRGDEYVETTNIRRDIPMVYGQAHQTWEAPRPQIQPWYTQNPREMQQQVRMGVNETTTEQEETSREPMTRMHPVNAPPQQQVLKGTVILIEESQVEGKMGNQGEETAHSYAGPIWPLEISKTR